MRSDNLCSPEICHARLETLILLKNNTSWKTTRKIHCYIYGKHTHRFLFTRDFLHFFHILDFCCCDVPAIHATKSLYCTRLQRFWCECSIYAFLYNHYMATKSSGLFIYILSSLRWKETKVVWQNIQTYFATNQQHEKQNTAKQHETFNCLSIFNTSSQNAVVNHISQFVNEIRIVNIFDGLCTISTGIGANEGQSLVFLPNAMIYVKIYTK